jgi:small-conductance mechanosensitive channel
MDSLLATGEALLRPAAILVGSLAAGLVIHAVLVRVLRRIAVRTETGLDDSLVRHEGGPTRALVVLLAVNLALPLLTLSPSVQELVGRVVGALLVATLVWVTLRLDVDAADNLRARSVHTQYAILRKIVIAVAAVLALGAVLMQFERVRQLGTGILASAGIIGIIVGFAAQKSLATLFAGIQIALTQPIRIDDVVVVEGEWGRIEEITLTYVVVRIWDQRRLVLPITYFLDRPFQNWTRVSADILGTVYLYADHTIPVDEVRAELERIVADDERWDGRVCGLQVTNVTERTVELRALVSAADSGKAWDLRCAVRERLVALLQERYPECLPRLRAEIGEGAERARAAEGS